MKKFTFAIGVFLVLCSCRERVQYDDNVTPSERAEILTAQVARGGIVSTVEDSALSDRDVQMLGLILDINLPGSDEARALMERRLGGPAPDTAPEFKITYSEELMGQATEMWDGAMDMIQERREADKLLGNSPARSRMSSGPPILYSVWVENQTDDTVVDEMVIFYKKKNNSLMEMKSQAPVIPKDIAMFSAGVCSRLESYALGIYIGDTMVARIPAKGKSMTPKLASVIHPKDKDPCKDTWGFGR